MEPLFEQRSIYDRWRDDALIFKRTQPDTKQTDTDAVYKNTRSKRRKFNTDK